MLSILLDFVVVVVIEIHLYQPGFVFKIFINSKLTHTTSSRFIKITKFKRYETLSVSPCFLFLRWRKNVFFVDVFIPIFIFFYQFQFFCFWDWQKEENCNRNVKKNYVFFILQIKTRNVLYWFKFYNLLPSI